MPPSHNKRLCKHIQYCALTILVGKTRSEFAFLLTVPANSMSHGSFRRRITLRNPQTHLCPTASYVPGRVTWYWPIRLARSSPTVNVHVNAPHANVNVGEYPTEITFDIHRGHHAHNIAQVTIMVDPGLGSR